MKKLPFPSERQLAKIKKFSQSTKGKKVSNFSCLIWFLLFFPPKRMGKNKNCKNNREAFLVYFSYFVVSVSHHSHHA